MTTLEPRPAYSQEELKKLYPSQLKLQLVQVLMRHGERSPVSARFQSAGLASFWPYCAAARRLSSIIMTDENSAEWDKLEWRRRLETFGEDDSPVVAAGPSGQLDAVCNLGELTDKGRATTLSLGRRLRHLYVEQLGYMPRLLTDADMIYLRATPIPRALESVQQAFWGMYPLSARTGTFPAPTIITRTPADETLYPNDGNCRRLSQLSRAFAQRTADRWNNTSEMEYLNKLISKWMPVGSERVAVDSHPRLSGIMDTINSTLAHGQETRLPNEFYDAKGRDIIERIGVEEWFSGYYESREYRALGIGSLLGDIVSRMIGSVEGNGNDGLLEIGGDDRSLGTGRGGEKRISFALSGCHDTTLASLLSSVGAFQGERWPPYTSHVALELFQETDRLLDGSELHKNTPSVSSSAAGKTESQQKTLWDSLFGKILGDKKVPPVESISRRVMDDLDKKEKEKLEGYYVRLRYNDRPMVVPGCKAAGKHLNGDESFCTLAAFKSIVDKFTPTNWKRACTSNMDEPPFPPAVEPGGI
ncbi:MAG: hypothetical protein M1833_002085 [Piccolia ochrophora]|nr:MAG: hypothetical protein M1833_002085 [Piccolia ochrophora]